MQRKRNSTAVSGNGVDASTLYIYILSLMKHKNLCNENDMKEDVVVVKTKNTLWFKV